MDNTNIEIKEVVSGEMTVSANFEEVRQIILSKVAGFDTMSVTDETIKDAKSYRAEVNRYISQVKETVQRVKARLLEPVDGFKKEADAFIAELFGYHENLDTQIKDMERKAKEDKKAKVIAYYESVTTEEERNALPYSKIEDTRWYNVSTSAAAYKREIDAKVMAYRNDMAIIKQEEEPYLSAMMKAYEQTGQLSAAISKKNELIRFAVEAEAKKQREAAEALAKAEAEAKRKAEEEARRKEEEAKKAEQTQTKEAPNLFGAAPVMPAAAPKMPNSAPAMPGGMLFGTNQKPNVPPVMTTPVMAVPNILQGKPKTEQERSIDEVFTYIINILSRQQLNKLGIDALCQLKDLQKRVAKELDGKTE